MESLSSSRKLLASEKVLNFGITKFETDVLATNVSSDSSEYTTGDNTESDI